MAPEAREVHLLNKPAGVVSTAADTHGRPTVVEYVPSQRRLYPVGRLDADTTGLILLTNDGALAERLTHPRYGVERTYRASVPPAEIAAAPSARLRAGSLWMTGRTHPGAVSVAGPGLIEITIAEGRKRQVRRMLRGRWPQGGRSSGWRSGRRRWLGLPEGETRGPGRDEVALVRRRGLG